MSKYNVRRSKGRSKASKQSIDVIVSHMCDYDMVYDRFWDFLRMLTYKRPHKSRSEGEFIKTFLLQLPNAHFDPAGNIQVHIKSGDSVRDGVLWSAHTDTVHNCGGRQSVFVSSDYHAMLLDENESNCLGADNAAGCWILTQLIKSGIPGHYVFHRCEERGGVGSSWLAKSGQSWISECKVAIAFDRRGTTDIIVDQAWGRCASDEFASSLADALGLPLKAADGVYTDTAEYINVIPECTNISVGTVDEHRWTESIDLNWLWRLRCAVLQLDVSKLVIARDPAVQARESGIQRSFAFSGSSSARSIGGGYNGKRSAITDDDDVSLLDLLFDDPGACADALEAYYGLTGAELKRMIDLIQHDDDLGSWA